jgi:hypothetical protein
VAYLFEVADLGEELAEVFEDDVVLLEGEDLVLDDVQLVPIPLLSQLLDAEIADDLLAA